MKWEYGDVEDFAASSQGLFIVCEGNFQYGNATLSYYDPASGEVQNEVFLRANGMKLGDVAQSMTMHDGRGWIVVNNSHVVFAIDARTFRETGRIDNLPSPRYIHFVDDTKAYITQLWDNRIVIVDPQRYAVTGYIEVPGMAAATGSTEQMVQLGRYVYCNCWSYQRQIIKIDTRTDEVAGVLDVGVQPRAIAADSRGRLWVLTDGGYAGNAAGHERPALLCVDTESFEVVQRMRLESGDTPFDLCTDSSGSTLYWINGGVWRMDVDAPVLPLKPFLPAPANGRFYSLTVSPHDGNVYVADAADYQQAATVYRYNADAELVDQFSVGVTPGAFCWK
ncbi:MAG: glutaminyl-peptide cyclotransferase [Muribaculaceae bacterium]|nr:glutaminyl-peptide cyclotransferase [Muribaculaceae bacterium]